MKSTENSGDTIKGQPANTLPADFSNDVAHLHQTRSHCLPKRQKRWCVSGGGTGGGGKGME